MREREREERDETKKSIYKTNGKKSKQMREPQYRKKCAPPVNRHSRRYVSSLTESRELFAKSANEIYSHQMSQLHFLCRFTSDCVSVTRRNCVALCPF